MRRNSAGTTAFAIDLDGGRIEPRRERGCVAVQFLPVQSAQNREDVIRQPVTLPGEMLLPRGEPRDLRRCGLFGSFERGQHGGRAFDLLPCSVYCRDQLARQLVAQLGRDLVIVQAVERGCDQFDFRDPVAEGKARSALRGLRSKGEVGLPVDSEGGEGHVSGVPLRPR